MATYESRRVGPNEFSFPSFPPQVIVADYDYEDLVYDAGDASFKFYVPIEGGLTVFQVGHLVLDDFAGGTDESLQLGDSDAPDTYAGGTDVTPVAGDMDGSATPKHYVDPDYVAVSFPGTGGAIGTTRICPKTAGEGRLFIFYIDKRTNWRTDGQI